MRNDSGLLLSRVYRAERIGMLAKDAEQTANLLWSVFGIGPFPSQDAGRQPASNGHLFADLGDLGIELFEDSTHAVEHADFVAARGEGFHHLLFDTDAYDETIAALGRYGCQVITAGGETATGRRWATIDTFKLLGWYIKIQQVATEASLTGGAQASNAGANLPVSGITLPRVELGHPSQIGIVVRDAAHTAELMGSLLGIGPFRFLEWPFVGRSDMQGFYDGRPGRFRMMLAFASLGNMELELLQPIEGQNVYSDFLAEKGEGLHHLLFEVSDIETKLARLSDIGIGVKMWGTARQPGARWMYLDTVPMLGWSVELRNKVQPVQQTQGRDS